MEFTVLACSYDCYGDELTLSLIPGFLLGDAEGFGSALTNLTVIFHFPDDGPPRRSLETLYKSFHQDRLRLPKVVFRRSRETAQIDVASDLIDGRTLRRSRALSLPLFASGVAETISALELLRKRLKPKDDFALDTILEHCRKAQGRLPATEEQLARLAADIEAKREARLAAMSSWEKVDVEWRDFHSDARRILNNPFFWETSNDLAPHGNDTGSDLLATYRKWLRRNPSGNPVGFFEQLMGEWGFPKPRTNEMSQTVNDEAAVALAFAELKLRGRCTPEIASLGLKAIRRQRKLALAAADWPHRDERLKSLDLLESTLTSVPCG